MSINDISRPHSSHAGAAAELIASAWLMRQGFQVFRNLCPTGPIDIVAVSADGKSHFFDVKAWDHDILDGTKWRAITQEQARLGVRLIKVDVEAGSCAIQEVSRVRGDLTATNCAHCGTEFRYERKNVERRFCQPQCSKRFHTALKRERKVA